MGYIAVIDYGVGNLMSVTNALQYIGRESKITDQASDLERADGIILPGVGAFPDAAEKLQQTGLVATLKEQAAKKPVLGICRGIQFLNVHLGGTLYQDLPAEHPSAANHHQTPPYNAPVHSVTLTADSPLWALLGKDTLAVNSLHHQAIKTLAPGLAVMAVSEDGLTEAVCLPDKRFVWAVQWHPEFSFRVNEDSRKIFKAFVGAC